MSCQRSSRASARYFSKTREHEPPHQAGLIKIDLAAAQRRGGKERDQEPTARCTLPLVTLAHARAHLESSKTLAKAQKAQSRKT